MCLNAYLMYCAGACLSAARTGMAAAIFWDTNLSRARRVFSVSYRGHIDVNLNGILVNGLFTSRTPTCFPIHTHYTGWLTSWTLSSSGLCNSVASSFRTSLGSRSVYLLKTTYNKERWEKKQMFYFFYCFMTNTFLTNVVHRDFKENTFYSVKAFEKF